MEALIPASADCEVRSVRSVIKFLNAQSIAPIKIHQLCQVYGPNVMSKQMVHRWCRQFSAGRQSVHDEKRSGQPSIITDDLVELVRERIMENRHVTITELSSHVPQISPSLLHEIVTEHLLFRKLCARWVPKQLTPEHKTKRTEMLSASIVFLHDNARPHMARQTANLLQEFSWEVFNHQPYSPDLAPSDFHLFLHLKKFLSGERQHFENDREAEMVVTQWFQSQAADFCDTGIQKLVPRYDKCLNSSGDYVKKYEYLNTCCICCNKYFHDFVFCFCKRPQGNLLCGRALYFYRNNCLIQLVPNLLNYTSSASNL
ncbi:hypothetical protein B7P43_G12124 [Cryptotermes secundus]|uniref:Mos1 transposase HTH domain-containing protein n=1 Tax=Cryptotermes secundus TaxID=105785 RepID=A0A2J7PE51_9NEOP|nr:hypothetical protein B7P43_G12124 [Cryptotermes secundus]